MAESLTEPKKHLALDTDWLSALGAIWLFCLFAFFGAGTIWMLLRGTLKPTPVSWVTPLLAGTSIYFGIRIPEKLFKIAAFVFAIGPVSRIILWLVGASTDTWLINEIFIEWIFALWCLAACIYVIYWFRTKITHV